MHLLCRADDLDPPDVLGVPGRQGTAADTGDLITAHTPLLGGWGQQGWPVACDDPTVAGALLRFRWPRSPRPVLMHSAWNGESPAALRMAGLSGGVKLTVRLSPARST